MRSKSWQSPPYIGRDYTNYYRVSQAAAQTTCHTTFESVLTRTSYLMERSCAPIKVEYTEDKGKTFRFVGGIVAEEVKALKATA